MDQEGSKAEGSGAYQRVADRLGHRASTDGLCRDFFADPISRELPKGLPGKCIWHPGRSIPNMLRVSAVRSYTLHLDQHICGSKVLTGSDVRLSAATESK